MLCPRLWLCPLAPRLGGERARVRGCFVLVFAFFSFAFSSSLPSAGRAGEGGCFRSASPVTSVPFTTTPLQVFGRTTLGALNRIDALSSIVPPPQPNAPSRAPSLPFTPRRVLSHRGQRSFRVRPTTRHRPRSRRYHLWRVMAQHRPQSDRSHGCRSRLRLASR